MSGEGNNEASGVGLIRGATVDGEAANQRGEGDGVAEPSTPGREVASLLWASPEYVDKVMARARQCDALEAEREALRARVAELEAAARWVPVSERLPPHGEDVLVWSPGWTAATQGYRNTRDVFVSLDEVDMPSATHWRPIPAGPEVQP